MKIISFLKKSGIDYLMITFGSTLVALSLILFLVPAKIAPGGVSSIAMILFHLFKLPVGMVMLIFNIPLFIAGIKTLGKRFGPRTVYAFTMVSLIYEFFDKVCGLEAATTDKLLASVFGGIVLGFGLGIVFRSQGSTGGSDIVGQIIHKYTNVSVGIGIMMIDFIVISFAGFAFQDITLALYGFISLYASSKVVDITLDGFDYARSFYIISEKQNEIIRAITHDLNRGGTIIPGIGFYTRKARNILFIVVTRKEVETVRQTVKKIDPNAFVIISNVHEVLGEGFRPRV